MKITHYKCRFEYLNITPNRFWFIFELYKIFLWSNHIVLLKDILQRSPSGYQIYMSMLTRRIRNRAEVWVTEGTSCPICLKLKPVSCQLSQHSLEKSIGIWHLLHHWRQSPANIKCKHTIVAFFTVSGDAIKVSRHLFETGGRTFY